MTLAPRQVDSMLILIKFEHQKPQKRLVSPGYEEGGRIAGKVSCLEVNMLAPDSNSSWTDSCASLFYHVVSIHFELFYLLFIYCLFYHVYLLFILSITLNSPSKARVIATS